MALPVVCFLACAGVLLDWSEAYPMSSSHSRGEPNVVMQSVVVGKKSQLDDEDSEDCPKCTFNHMKAMLRNLFQSLQPDSIRTKREYKDMDEEEGEADSIDDRTIDRLIQILEEMKRDRMRSRVLDAEEIDEREKERKKQREDYEEEDLRRGKKKERYRARKEDEEEYLQDKKEQEAEERKRHEHRSKDWRQEEQNRRNRLRQELADSWPKEEEHIYLPVQVRRGPHHQRIIGGFLR